jgi:Rieske Fe-S protein
LLPGRRTFFGWLTYAMGAVGAAVAGIPLVKYFLGTPTEPAAWVKLGHVDDFPLSQTRMVTFENPIRQPWDGHAAHTGVFVRREDAPGTQAQFLVMAVNCTHLGCPVTWFPDSGLFMCPCHGGVYYANGEHASGPPPRGLFHCQWRVKDGQLEVEAPHFPSLQDTLDDPQRRAQSSKSVAGSNASPPFSRSCEHA